jgi:hypothetical protein
LSSPTQQLVAREMTAGVVDDLELVQVEVAQRMTRLVALAAGQSLVQLFVEFAAVHQAG